MAKDGIHAVLVVLSVRSRFSLEEVAAIESLRKFFGTKISDYMIVIFTGGDDLKGVTLNDYLGRNCPEALKVAFEDRYICIYLLFISVGYCFCGSDSSIEGYFLIILVLIQEMLKMCGNRCVLFDNRTEDELKKYEQLKELVFLVNAVVHYNGGKPYTDELFVELKASFYFPITQLLTFTL